MFVNDHESDRDEKSESCCRADAADHLRRNSERSPDVVAEQPDLELEVLAHVDDHLGVGGVDRGWSGEWRDAEHLGGRQARHVALLVSDSDVDVVFVRCQVQVVTLDHQQVAFVTQLVVLELVVDRVLHVEDLRVDLRCKLFQIENRFDQVHLETNSYWSDFSRTVVLLSDLRKG